MSTRAAAGRFLLVSTPLVAHANPLASLSRELTARGHLVAFAGYSETQGLFSKDIRFFALQKDETYTRAMAEHASESVRSTPAAFLTNWQDIAIPLCRSMVPGVDAAFEDFQPDVMLVDQHSLAGALVARRRGIPWATSAPSADLLIDYSSGEFSQGASWLKSMLDELQKDFGLEPIDSFEKSPQLVLLYTSRAFAGESTAFPPHYRFVGANIERRLDDTPFPWEALDPSRKLVYVSLGSIIGNRGARFLEACVEALRDQPVQVIVSDPKLVIKDAPDNFIVRTWVPQIELLPKVDAVITHGGSSVNEALAFGIPLVVAPYHLDNFIYASKVLESGAGLRLRFGRSSSAEVRHAVLEVLNNPAYRDAAARMRRSFEAAGGTEAAADELEKLLDGRKDTPGR